MRLRLSVLAAAIVLASHAAGAQSRIPSRLSDAEFWYLSHTLSEADGFFQSENYVSNEQEMQKVIPRFASISDMARGVYLGVGPEQNYTYIAAMRPQIAFILDIRRGNLLEHLLYKAIFELSEDRADFLSRLLSKPRPVDLARHSSIDLISDRLRGEAADTALFLQNRAAVWDVLLKRHALPLSTADTLQLGVIYQMFFRGGLEITYSFPKPNTRSDATLYDLLVATDSTGVQRGFLATDSAFQFVKEMHARNMILPVVGDFAGPSALRAIGNWVRERNARIGAFYVSNVEQYLFQNDRWRPFYANVESLPIDSTSMFVRSVANVSYTVQYRGGSIGFRASDSTLIVNGRRALLSDMTVVNSQNLAGFRSVTSTMQSIINALRVGRLLEYLDLSRLSR